jgi:hypothetical protein
MVAHEHSVQVGIRTPEKAQILKGVDAGAQVVVAGGLGLADGAKVKLAEAEKDDGKKDDGKKDDGKTDKGDKEK